MAQIRVIQKRLAAVGTIQRITKTMQMIATAKFTASVQRAKATRPYTDKITQLVSEVAGAAGDCESPLLSSPAEPMRRELLLVISSDRGFCGAYNGNVLRLAMAHLRRCRDEGIDVEIETSGKKATGAFRFHRIEVTRHHAIGDAPRFEDVRRIASRFIDTFVEGRFDAIRVAFMQFQSNARQVPTLLPLLPLDSLAGDESPADEGPSGLYDFTPSAEALLEDLLPLSVRVALFQVFNDAVMSEQIMRMVAMKAATENAKELGRTLRRTYNRARQTKITTELSEIVGGAAALA